MREDPSHSLPMRSTDRGKMERAEKHAAYEGAIKINLASILIVVFHLD